jgi:hypothetical protein
VSLAQNLEWRRAAWGFGLRYEVSNYGDVRNIGNRSRLLKPQIDRGGYIAFHLYRDNGTVRNTRIGRLVMETFVGPMPPGMEVRHLDDDRKNNRLENLAYGTRGDNMQDAIKNGRNFHHLQTKCRNDHDYPEDRGPGTPARCLECLKKRNEKRNLKRRQERAR